MLGVVLIVLTRDLSFCTAQETALRKCNSCETPKRLGGGLSLERGSRSTRGQQTLAWGQQSRAGGGYVERTYLETCSGMPFTCDGSLGSTAYGFTPLEVLREKQGVKSVKRIIWGARIVTCNGVGCLHGCLDRLWVLQLRSSSSPKRFMPCEK